MWKSAERITGWSAEDVLGRPCFDNILCHIDKDGHQLCGQEYCPLHRSIVTGTGSSGSLLVFAQSKGGKRIPMLVSVAPLRNAEGDVIGGVETFQDASDMVHDLVGETGVGNGVGSHLCRFAALCDRSPVGTEAFWAARGT